MSCPAASCNARLIHTLNSTHQTLANVYAEHITFAYRISHDMLNGDVCSEFSSCGGIHLL